LKQVYTLATVHKEGTVAFPKRKTLSRSTWNSAVTNNNCKKLLEWTQLHLTHFFMNIMG